ncbi:MAG: M23 family metallopeptidase [Clostridia bacterium]|nr:M23 family metallopeptidase [Clostridia bacterium]
MNNTNSTKKTNKFTRFLRNNAALLILILCVLAIATVVLVVTLTSSSTPPVPDTPVVIDPGNNDDDKPDPTPTVKDKVKVYFASPLKYSSISMEYTDGKDLLFVFSSTLNAWESHNGVDLIADEGTNACAMYDGTVIDVKETFAMGNIVTIDHGDNVIATYASLADVQVVKGQTVKKGDKIGEVSTSASNEFMDGAHLHLEITKNGANVDPMPYVNGTVFREFEVE